MSVKQMTTRQVRDRFATVVDDARNGEPTVVTQRGRRVAAIVPVDLLDEYDRLREAADMAVIRERLALADVEPTYSFDEVLAETLARTE